MRQNILVSICIPAYNSAAFIYRALESAVNQTYKNIEIVICDNASTDNTEKIVMKYANQDSRIKYIRNDANIGSSNNYLKCAECATGEFMQALGSDDWLSRNYIEEGMKLFMKNPKAASIFTNIVTLEIIPPAPARFLSESIIKQGRYSTNWFFKQIYHHPYLAGMGFQSLMRRVDFIEATQKALSNPINLIDRGERKEAFDSTTFWELLIKYNYFVVTNQTTLIMTAHGKDHVGLQGGFFESEDGFIGYMRAIRLAYESFYSRSENLKKYLGRMRLSFGLGIIQNILVKNLLKQRKFSPSFLKKKLSILEAIFFNDYTKKEKLLLITILPFYFLLRLSRRYRIKLFRRRRLFLPTSNHFLTKDFDFQV